jgi:UDP-N-acetylmuramoyl-tripeptide--D-alanyl-D-alanine ligase
MTDQGADFTAKDIVVDERGCHAFVLVTPAGEASINLSLAGKHNVGNALAAAACAHAAGVELGLISSGLNKLQQVPGRLNLERLVGGSTLIDDTYNANPGSVKAAINTLMAVQGRHILVLGDMGELGNDEARLHGGVGQYAAEKGVDVLLAVGPLCVNAVREFGEQGKHFDNKKQLSEYLVNGGLEELLAKDTVVLIKGSRFMAMEKVVQQIIDSGAQ